MGHDLHDYDVRSGSKSEVGSPERHVRSTLNSRRHRIAPAGPLGAKARSLQRLGSWPASSVDVGGSIPSPPTTAGSRYTCVSNIWLPAGRSGSCICYHSSHHRGWHICPRNLRLDPHIPRLSLLLPVN